MNGIVANPTFPPARRLVRGILIFACSVLCVSLVGAVHTRPIDAARPDAARPVETTMRAPSAAPAIDFDEDDALPAAGGEMLQQIKTNTVDVKPIAAAINITTIQKTLLPTAAPAAPAPSAPRFAVRMMEVTAYCPCKKCCGPRAQGITASGRLVTFNGGRFVAADKAFSFHTRLVIPGYADGQAVPVLDRGGAIKGDKLDVYFPSHAQARQWGRRFIPVQVLN